jgi:hypothetical protein
MSNSNFSRIFKLTLFLVFTVLEVKCEAQVDTTKPFQVNFNINNKTAINKIRKLVLRELIKETGDPLKLNDIALVKLIGECKLEDIGDSWIYKVKMSNDLPADWNYGIVLVINRNHKGYLILLDIVELIRIKQNSNEYYFAGRFINRYGYGNFEIFKFYDNHMDKIFESQVPVTNSSYDCTSYKNGNLQLQNIDVNKDGYLDLKFSGIKYSYCKGLETYGRLDKKPIKQEKISIIFYYNPKDSTWVQGK